MAQLSPKQYIFQITHSVLFFILVIQIAIIKY
jgi:hypothetical protein